MNEQAKYKLKGFIFMFLSSSAMGGIGAFGRYINAPGDFISFGRNFIGFIALTIIFAVAARGNFKKLRTTILEYIVMSPTLNQFFMESFFSSLCFCQCCYLWPWR